MTKEEFQNYKECAFDAFAKAVIRNTGTSLYRIEAVEAQHKVNLNFRRYLYDEQLVSDIADDLDSKLYPFEKEIFRIRSYSIFVSNADLIKALYLLKPKLREVILLSTFTEMTDREAAAYLGVPKSTFHDRKIAALRRLQIHLSGKRGSL